MKTKLLFHVFLACILLSVSNYSFGQATAPSLGTAAHFVLFSTNGGVTNTGSSLLTGNVGANNGSVTGFGNVNGVMHYGDGTSAQSADDLLIAYNELNSTIATKFPAPLLGNGDTLTSGVYSIPSKASLNLNLILDAQGNADAVFIFQIHGAFSTSAAAEVKLINGALASNVFWKVEGLVEIASGSVIKGTIIANNAAIVIGTGVNLEGRALSTTGAISIASAKAFLPTDPNAKLLTGPVAPDLASTKCYALFSGNGEVTNAGVSHILGDVGTNVGLTVGFDALYVGGSIHPIPDTSTAECAADLSNVYTYLNALPYDIELLYPAKFGNNLTLTPHTYILNGATVLTDTLYLDAQANSDAVFVIQIYGALSTSTYSKIVLVNGARSENVYWVVNGAVSINDYSIFRGTLVANNGGIALNSGIELDGRALTTIGALNTAAITTTMAINCTTTNINNGSTEDLALSIVLYPNPFSNSLTIFINGISQTDDYKINIYNALGEKIVSKMITGQTTKLRTDSFGSGIYLYEVTANNKIIQRGKLISNQ
jgi:Ice-binding-like/Secretion system C-terminal sorting domain